MKSYFAWIAIISFCLLSGCAYLKGRDEQKAAAAAEKPSTNGKAIVVNTQTPTPPMNQRPNPAATASKMIAPITQ